MYVSHLASPSRLLVFLLLVGCAGAGCSEEAEPEGTTAAADLPPLETSADTVAQQIYSYFGGPQAWQQLPYLRFDFAVEQNGQRQTVARHLWNRQSGDYRVEWRAGADSIYAALFNVNTQEGQVYLNGDSVASARNQELLDQAYRRFVNDTYWMLAPTKLFDPGVNRSYVADSSNDSLGVIQLSFDDVGLTPKDRYWLYADRETGRLERWGFILQGQSREAPSTFRWTDYEHFSTPAGTLRVATRKEALGGGRAILTDRVRMPREVPQEMFTDPSPRLLDNSSQAS